MPSTPEQEKKDLRRRVRAQLAQLESEQDKISRSSYNEDARNFNARLEKFPANLLRHVAGVEPLATFDSA